MSANFNEIRRCIVQIQIQCEFDRFIISHFIIPFIVFVAIFTGLEFSRFDLGVARYFYDPFVQKWPWREHWLTKTILHDWGQKFNVAIGILLFVAFLSSCFKSALRPYFKSLAFLFVASVTGPALIAVLKSSTPIYCPWDLRVFGGDKPYVRLFDFAAYPLTIGHCFPAAHAGGGYAFISLYFFLLVVKPAYRYYGLSFGIVMGLLFGITQQVRGAHFLSHDVFSLAICWFSSLLLFGAFFGREVQWKP